MQEISDNGRKSYENLAAAERQISHLNSENIQLRKLRDELDSASLKSAHQLRQINTLESELSNLRGENKLLRQKKSNVMGNTDETDYRGIYDTHPQPLPSTSFSLEKPLTSLSPRPPPSRSEKDRNLHNLSEVEVYPRPPPYPSDDAIIYQQQQPMAYGSKASKFLAAYTASGSAEMKVPHGDTNYGNHSGHHNGSSSSDSQKNWDQDSQRKHRMSAPAAASLTVRSLADLIGNRRSTVGDNWSRNTSEDNYYSLDSDFPSSSGAHENNRNKWNMENLPGNEGNIQNSSKTAASHSSLSTLSRMTSDSRTDGRKNNSGGGVSSFYDDSNDPVVRAPFGTALSASENMVSFADTEKKLTSLMTEKSVLYEESARLQQRGGKILKDRARLQHVDARLVEIGKEIAVERKKLSGKPG